MVINISREIKVIVIAVK